jgi:hypothetical protein
MTGIIIDQDKRENAPIRKRRIQGVKYIGIVKYVDAKGFVFIVIEEHTHPNHTDLADAKQELVLLCNYGIGVFNQSLFHGSNLRIEVPK